MILLNKTTIPTEGAGGGVKNIIDDALKISDALNTYGYAIVLLSIFLIIFIIFIMVILKQNSNSQKMFQEQNQILLNQILTNSNKQIQENEESKFNTFSEERRAYDEKNIVTIFVKLNRIFKFECKKYLERIDCDRIGIYVFHNGTVTSHGLPFFKVSCICEWIKRGTAICSHINDTNGIPLNLFDDIIDNLYTKGIVLVCNDPTNQDSAFIKSDSFYLDTDDVEFAMFVPIYDKNDNILAMVLAEYRHMVDKEFMDEYLDELKELCRSIKPVLEFSEYQDINTIERGMSK